ncbi:MAG: signal peptidase I [Candidatus Paceibacterota bacterium]
MLETTPEDNNEDIPNRRSLRTRSDRYEKNKDESFFGDLIRFSLLSIIIVIPIRLFIVSPFVVNGSSMEPTFSTGEYLIVDQLSYRLHEPERGDVVIFHYPQDPSKFFIKRVVGLPNETVILSGNTVRIINNENPEGFYLDESFLTYVSENGNETFSLNSDEYVVLGDNRLASSDSRSWGTLNRKLIVGRALLRLFPVTSITVLPGEVRPEDFQSNL